MRQFCDWVDSMPCDLFYGGLLLIVVLVLVAEYRKIGRQIRIIKEIEKRLEEKFGLVNISEKKNCQLERYRDALETIARKVKESGMS